MADFTITRMRDKGLIFPETWAAKKWVTNNLAVSTWKEHYITIDWELIEEMITFIETSDLTVDVR